MRWTDRLIGLVSTLILARLLAPEDFGIIAMASLAIGLLDVLLDLGVNVALIQNPKATSAHYDTAWTLRLLQSAVAASIIFLGAPLAGEYFGDARVIPVMQVLSASIIIAGLENIGIIEFQKKMQFGLDFRFMFLKRIVGFIATISAAFLMQSYWALVIGTLTGRVIGMLVSYRMHPMRPRISVEKFGEIFAVSQWMLVRSSGQYLDTNLHKILVGRRADSAVLGGYTLADEISAMPSTELLAPINRALFPAFVAAKENIAELKRLFLMAQGVQTLIGIPAGIGLAMVAPEIVGLLLGEKWLPAVPFVQILALVGSIQAITTSGGYVLITLGRVRQIALISWAQIGVFVIGAFTILPDAGASALAMMRLATVTIGLFTIFWLLTRALESLSAIDMAATISRPIFGAAAMAGALHLLDESLSAGALPLLITKLVVGVVVYTLTVLALWALFGRGRGAEAYVLEKIRALIAARRKSAS
ncbi:polysaccharide biosynthesis protein [Thauera linaloolentis 47Lol = DSM 12138]|uniref:Polysaccharide biosynthesis protein n=2 Tax=Thauera linaloolentis TaxID=76112 RepID=N6Z8B3_THAL4|nr:polysaccharide biosynthesis protein [Thauera linaloolentis 47Lol = DSM 12138]